MFVDFRQATFKQCHTVEDDSAVHLELRLTRTAKAYRSFSAARARTATLTFEVGPHALQARQHIFVLSQLHLRLGVGRLGTHGEDVEDELCAVDDAHFQLVLNVADLLRAEFVVEDHHIYIPLRFEFGLDPAAHLFELSFAHISDRIGPIELLREAFDAFRASRFGQKSQLVEVFVSLAFVLRFGDERNEHRLFHAVLYFFYFEHNDWFDCKNTIL